MRIALLCLICIVSLSCRATEPPGTVKHVVFCWLKTPGDESARQRIIDETAKFRTIPGVVGVTAGRAVPSTRPVVDSSFDVGLVITFRDEAALKAYDTDPVHVKSRDEVLRPLSAKLLVYDIKK